MTQVKYDNEVITETLTSSDMYSGMSFATSQIDYLLSAADYMKLKNNWVSLYSLAVSCTVLSLGFALNIFPKLYSSFVEGGSVAVSDGEWAVLLGALAVSALLFVVGLFMPSEKTSVMKAIDKHFKTVPKTRHMVRVQNV